MIARALNLLGWFVGLSLVVLGAARIALPVATILGSEAMSASVDSETRAGGVLLIGLGFAYLWAVRQLRVPVMLLRVLALTMGGLALSRLLSIVVVGMPHPVFVAAAGAEFAAAALTLWYSAIGPK
ncbi:DUF4345 domain-containing protein [Mycolicibacterium sp. lyk4-40-TYG-92]|uniref:DUF4345 domain-containing protein n=1 Tax=Mycolicibacterium sp. lyk4-40-TYG-92 TaxID=3040295 RepID=UPI00254B3097|nr:DUF4345 domain-containing protein [Mycolicibacterium sp. lyk4-40-TYG-92]